MKESTPSGLHLEPYSLQNNGTMQIWCAAPSGATQFYFGFIIESKLCMTVNLKDGMPNVFFDSIKSKLHHHFLKHGANGPTRCLSFQTLLLLYKN